MSGLRGGVKPTLVKLVTARSPLKSVTVRERGCGLTACHIAERMCVGPLCQVDLEEEEDVSELKRKLAQAVPVPVCDMKIRLGGYNQFVMIDTASNIRVGSTGVTMGASRR